MSKNKKDNTVEEINTHSVIKELICFIIAIIFIGVIGWFVYTNFFKIEAPKNTKKATSFIAEDKDALELGKTKHQWLINQKNSINNSYVFFDKTLDVNNIKNEDILAIAYRSTQADDRKKNKDCDGDDCYNESFNKNLINEQIKRLFTSDLRVNLTDFRPTGTYLCKLNDENYDCKVDSSAELENDPIYNISGFLDARAKNEYLYVYSTIMSVKRVLDVYSEEEQGIYAYNDLNNKIDDLTFYNQYENELTQTNMEILINHYKNQLPVYKSTFKLEGNSYVWISTELEK